MNNRTELEIAILGACVLESYAYPQVMDFLSHKNFSKPNIDEGIYADHQLMYQAFETLWPNKPIELRSVANHFKNNREMVYWVANYQSQVSSSANLRYYASELLEYSFKDAFFAISQKYKDAIKGVSTTLAAIIEIEDEVFDGDILEILPKAVVYLRDIGSPEEIIAEFSKLDENVQLKLKKIKQQANVDALVNNLNNIRGLPMDTPTRMCLHNLTEAIKEIMITGSVTKTKQDLIFQL